MTHELGAVLIESKALSVLARRPLPNRSKLKRDIAAHISKAFSQLRGAIRKLKANADVTSLAGTNLKVEREHPAHAIVLIPDLELVEDPTVYGLEFMRDFTRATGCIAHLLDISELLRVVQAAEMIAARDETFTPISAFIYYLTQRAEKAFHARTLCIKILLRFADQGA